MNIDLLKRVGNLDQVCGIRESRLVHGAGQGISLTEFHNQAGLRFTVVPDRCMDIFDFSYKGVNFAFLSRNGMRSPMSYTAMNGEFSQQWSGGMLSTCGLDNVGGHCESGGIYPTHGRISATPATNFGTKADWEGEDFILEAWGEIHQTRLYGAHLKMERHIRTTMNARSVTIDDTITNMDATDEPYLLLYHCNFGHPLLSEKCIVYTTDAKIEPLNDISTDPAHMLAPIDRRGEELYMGHLKTEKAGGLLYNPELQLAGYIAFDSTNLSRFLEWKMMKSHDYVLALEPCNTWAIHRADAIAQNKAAILPAYSTVKTGVEIGVLDGEKEIETFIAAHDMKEASL